MQTAAGRSLLLLSMTAVCCFVASRHVGADEVPQDTNQIESLTPERARKLVATFPGVEITVEGDFDGSMTLPQALPLNGLKTLDADTARALAGFKGQDLSLGGLTTLDADTAKALAANEKWNGRLFAFTVFDSPDSVAIAAALAMRKGPLALPNLKKISPNTLSALIKKEDIRIPAFKKLEMIREPDGTSTDDFVIP